ncbi:MAG: 3-ketoacyl-CoA thiolase (EC @ Acetyl-CoA acetyltransferase (EC [uncultured Campylobacterales bacterium]|uniref:3-ketoacyl-CoA thiolase ) n=1 Tax=uncultured Campylobacterales bacterium TaxID=352960 RepID=A0A6S6T733_9BACT|nr:MAG: 3-ketoacyl-CoA thiolase (EC @ Acetyl-CoA acetyltransferase (EC [uncultured Campylobacterales bacterium]
MRIAIVDGLRSPVAKAGGKLADIAADDLGANIVKELALRVGLDFKDYDEVIIGNVSSPAHAANIARVIALKAGFDTSILAHSVHRNCASGMESITQGADKVILNNGIYMCGGVESMSNIPLFYNKKMTEFFTKLSRAKSIGARLSTLASFRLSFLKPRVGLIEGLTDPTNGLIMGMTAENIAKDFGISRTEQDEYALSSHQKATNAIKSGILNDEISPIAYGGDKIMSDDDGVRMAQSMKDLGRLRPIFDKKNGTVTAGNSSQVSDAAGAVVLMSEEKAKEMGLNVLGYLKSYAYAGCEPSRMGLGPVYSTAKVLKNTGMSMSDFDIIELNEAFAAQVLGCIRAFDSDKYAQDNLGLSSKVGAINTDILNVNGGGIAIGHPVGMTGTRIVLHALKELKRRGKQTALATLCIGGGQGASLVLEAE